MEENDLKWAADCLYSALSISRGQWIHSVNKDKCLIALEIYEETVLKDNQKGQMR